MMYRGSGGGGGGKGGGGGDARAATEAPDSLRSRAYARVIDAISEGEIEGLVDGLKSIYLDDTPVMAADGAVNFPGLWYTARNGTQAQLPVPGFPAAESEQAVAVELKAAAPVVRALSNAALSAVRVTVSVPQLSYQDMSNGGITGTSVAIAIDIDNNGGGWQEVVADTISGKTMSRYQRSYRIDLPSPGPWQLRVRRLTADSTQSNLQNKTFFDSYTEIIDVNLAYPNTALVALQIDAANFQRIPRRGYDIRGLKLRVPVNYDPVNRTYSGVWNGAFKVAWTDNPAWCFYDLITSERYGLGGYIDAAQVDKWALYEIARYCDELVPDGFGGMEPRFTCNLYLQTRQEAYAVLQQMAAIFRGMVWWTQGALTCSQDRPSDPVALFTAANVVDGAFQYSGASARARHTVALVAWNDPADMYRQKVEYVEDRDGIARYGVRETEIVAVGCASRGQAHRLGRWLLYTERMESETVTFRCGLEGVYLYPGAVIAVQDPFRSGRRNGGRIVSATAGAITLDAPVTIAAGVPHELSVMLPDGTVETRTVTTTGNTDTLAVAPDFSAVPQTHSVWVLAAADLKPTLWRVVSVTEVDGHQAEVTALAHHPGKYDAIERDLVLEPIPVTSLALVAPQNVRIVESLYLSGPGIVGARATISWDIVPTAARYEVAWRIDDDNPGVATAVSASFDIDGIRPGLLTVSVRAIDHLGRYSQATTLTQAVYGKSAPPAQVTGLSLTAIGGQAHLSWHASPDLDVLTGGAMRIRHTPAMTGAVWDAAIDIATSIPGSATTAVLPLLAGTYLAKWVDSSGNESVEPTIITTDAPNILALNVVEDVIEHPDWAGQKTNTYVSDGAIRLDSADTIAQRTDPVSSWPMLSLLGGVAASGNYASPTIVDMGEVHTARLTAMLDAHGLDMSDTIGTRAGHVSDWPMVSGGQVTDVAARLEVSTTPDDPGASPAWSSWQPLVVGDYAARAFRFRLVLESGSATHNIAVSACRVTVDMPDRIVQAEGVVSGMGVKHIDFTPPFIALKALTITAEDMQTGDYYTISGKSASGFDIAFFNSSAAPVSRRFDWLAKGY